MIYPIERWEEIKNNLKQNGFFLHHSVSIIPREEKPVNRIIFSVGLEAPDTISSNIFTIRNRDGGYTETYKKLCYHCHQENLLFK